MKARLRLERMIHGGFALARLEDGRVALVRGGLPGEVVHAALEDKKGVLTGWVEELLEPSPDRVSAPAHPGLDYGFIRYERQLELKREVVLDALQRARAPEVNLPVPVASPERWGYRNTVQPVVRAAGLGYRRPESHEVVLLESDPVANEAIRRVWGLWPSLRPPKGVRELALRGNAAGEVLASLVATASARSLLPFAHELLEAGVAGVGYARFDARGRFRSGSEKLAGKRSILEHYGRFALEVTPQGFAQPNPGAASLLYARLAALAPGGELALDLYAGTGVIGMHLLGKYPRVLAFEIDRGSVARGQRTAKRLGLDGLEFVKADAKRLELPPEADLVALDPPRAGLSKDLREALSRGRLSTLLYVSCDPATWARDVADFAEKGWRLELAEPFDFYPHTHHIELLSLLRR